MPIPHSNTNVAVISNNLARASYNLTVSEHRLIKTYIKEIANYFDEELPPTATIYIPSYAADWNIAPSDARKELRKTVKGLFDRKIALLKDDESFLDVRWVYEVGYDRESDSVAIAWNPRILRHISLLKERFTKLDLLEMKDFSSSYTFRLYEILVCTAGENPRKKPSYLVEELMGMMDVPDSYRNYMIFKQRVLTPCVAELRSKVGKFARLVMHEVKKRGSKKVERVEFGLATQGG